jgi:trimeric autotransporter adhesin
LPGFPRHFVKVLTEFWQINITNENRLRRLGKRFYWICACLLCCLLTGLAQADAITRFSRFTGNYNYVVTGGSLRNQPNSVNSCSLTSSNTQTLSGIPAGSSIAAAILYWGGSGSSIDNSVSLNGNTVIADRTFTSTPAVTGTTFFGGSANVTSYVSGNGSFTFGNLTVDSSTAYCGNSSVMAGWALVVVYSNSSEPLRALNIFDGMDYFYNSSISLTPDGFRIPTSGIDGKFTAITWEGDPDIGGSSEFLAFNGSNIDSLSYDSTSHFSPGAAGTTTNGTDVDTYNIGSYLSPGQTTANTVYSAGGDLVFLAAQIISVTSTPQVDLSITKTHSGNFTVGTNGTYTLHVANASGVQQVDYLTTVTDTLPAGLTYVSAAGTGWSCSASGQTVSCTHAAPLASGSAFPDITLTVAVGNAAYPSISNTATVATAGSNDYITSNNSATDVATVIGSNLSTSTKTVRDINGGEANVGDTLRYTIAVINSSAVNATAVSVSDSVPGNTSNLQVVSYPSGATNTSTTSLLSIGNISVPANSSVDIVFDVTVATGTSPGATIDNTASISNPGGVSATPSAPTITVSPSMVAGSGTKQLYLWNNGTYSQKLYRTPPSGTHNSVSVNGNNQSITWTSTPTLQKAVTLNSGSYSVYVVMARTGDSGGGGQRNRTIAISLSNSSLGALGSASQTFSNMSTTTTLYSFTLNLASSVTAPAGSTFTLTINNNSNNTSTRSITVVPYSGSDYSRVELNSATVINVDSVQSYNATYNGGVVTSSFVRGSTAYVRAVVSDPFGSFDISSTSITLTNPSGTAVVTGAAMTQVADSGAATKTYEYSYAIPASAPAGVWTASVTAKEGTENTITDLGVGTFTVTIPMPALTVTKISNVIWDPVNGGTNPKRIPGSMIQYTITVTNSGPGAVDASTLVMTDTVPANTSLCVAAIAQCAIVQFADGSPVSGLSYINSNTSYSNISGGGTPFSYTPTADANGVDTAVTGLRIAPTGAMNGVSGGNPSFTITFRVKVN